MSEEKKQCILIVDDSKLSLKTLAAIFQDEWRIKIALDGQEALRIADSEDQPDLILLDISMPGMDGYETCRRLKASPTTKDIPIIFITGREETEDEEKGLTLGAIDYVVKPVHPAIIRIRVKNHLELKQLRDRLKEQTLVDGLTGLANRRRFDEQLKMEWNRALRHGKTLSLVMIDIDYFKRYNDRYGHLGGDDCLKAVASTLRAGARRTSDLVARWGGEEFACLLPETGRDQAVIIADEMRHAVQGLQLKHEDSDTSPFVSVSLGLSIRIPQARDKIETFIQEADKALYLAKHSGRNRLFVFGEKP
jgi:diguanylate cyclase (GGDEF)-like protein